MSKISKIEQFFSTENNVEILGIKQNTDGSTQAIVKSICAYLYSPAGECTVDGVRIPEFDLDFSQE